MMAHSHCLRALHAWEQCHVNWSCQIAYPLPPLLSTPTPHSYGSPRSSTPLCRWLMTVLNTSLPVSSQQCNKLFSNKAPLVEYWTNAICTIYANIYGNSILIFKMFIYIINTEVSYISDYGIYNIWQFNVNIKNMYTYFIYLYL